MKEQIREYILAEPGAGDEFSAEFCFPPAFRGFSGHFPGNPVLPGVCLVQAVLCAAGTASAAKLKLTEIVLAKFISAVLPDEKIVAAGRMNDGVIRAKLSRGEERIAEVRLRVENA